MKLLPLISLIIFSVMFINVEGSNQGLTFSPVAGLLRVYSEDFLVARLNPTTGEVSCSGGLEMPNSTCKWVLGKGTRGQNTAMFYVNQTFIFVAQEDCDGTVGRTATMVTIGPFCFAEQRISNSADSDTSILAPPPPPPYVRVNVVAYQTGIPDLESVNMAWDHACNIVVQAPQKDAQTYFVNQISDYDGHQRFQPSYTVQNGWKKVNGAGALDFGDFRSNWPRDQEWNCGDKCLFYTLEEQQVQQQQEQQPRYLVGRSYRLGNVVSNITDSVQIQSLSWNPYVLFLSQSVNQFIGIGKCCSFSWCYADCSKYGDNLVLISFFPATGGIEILAEIGEADDDTVRLGVEYSAAPFAKDYFAYIYHKNTVLSYALQVSNGIINSASLINTSPPVGFKVHMWANPGYN